MKFTEINGARRIGLRLRRVTGNGIGKRPSGAARVFRCAQCQRRLICSQVGVQWLCVECRGGQGQ